MSLLIRNLLITVVCNQLIIGQLYALPYAKYSILNETTTAVPPNNVTNRYTATTPTMSTSVSKIITTNNDYNGNTAVDKKTTIPSRSMSMSTIPTLSTNQQTLIKLITTTAVPIAIEAEPSYHHFDGLSFAGGALAAFGFMGLGTFAWKMYAASIERSYWTL